MLTNPQKTSLVAGKGRDVLAGSHCEKSCQSDAAVVWQAQASLSPRVSPTGATILSIRAVTKWQASRSHSAHAMSFAVGYRPVNPRGHGVASTATAFVRVSDNRPVNPRGYEVASLATAFGQAGELRRGQPSCQSVATNAQQTRSSQMRRWVRSEVSVTKGAQA